MQNCKIVNLSIMAINSITCKLIEKKGKRAEVEIDGQKIFIGSENLSANIKNGDNLELCFSDAETAKMKEKELAKAILEEILNGK